MITVAEFLEHVGTGRIDAVRATIDAAPAIVNAIGPHPFWGGRPQALHVAIEAGRREVFDLLLAHGADVNGVNDHYDHWSPLMLAVNRDRPDMIEALHRRGARVGLLEALMLGDDRAVEQHLRDGSLPAVAPNRGSLLAFARTPLAIDRLMALGARVDVADRWGSTPIDAFSRLGARGRTLVRHLVARGVSVAPQVYARLGDQDTLTTLLESNPDIVRDDALILGAVEAGHAPLVRWLLARGANVNARFEAQSRHTALHSAAWSGNLEVVRLLVEAGADVGAHDAQYDATPLGWAETSITVSNNSRCADVASYLRSRTPR